MVAQRHGSGLPVRAAIALTTACLFVACGLLAMHHAADVAHVRDVSGSATHGVSVDCHDGAPTTHLHEAPDHDDAGSCALTDILHQSVRVFTSVPSTIAPRAFVRLEAPATASTFVQRDLLLSAPKTSPPAIA